MSVRAIDESRAGEGVGVSRRALGVLWAAALVLMLVFAGTPAVTRTQEARVLETARQMLGEPAPGWMIPTLNDELRLKKPPLTYWMAAGAFEVGGVNEWAGRVPTVVVGWLTVGATYWAGAWVFGRRAGLLSAGCLLSSYLFFRHSRLAETDPPAALAVTVGVFAMWRGMVGRSAWFHLGAAGVAVAAMSKGAPGAFPIVFLIGAVVVTKRWGALGRFVVSGAPVTGLLIGVPWFAYVISELGWREFTGAMRTTWGGADHGKPVWTYFPMLFTATAPWCGVMVLALWEAGWNWRRDERVRVAVVWVLSIFVPLCLTGNKQQHYLLPLMPPVFVLVGWAIERAMAGRADDPRMAAMMKAVLIVTAGVTAVCGLGVVGASWHELRAVPVGVVGLAIVLLAGGVAAVVAARRGDTGGVAWGIVGAWAVALPGMTGWWFGVMQPENPRAVAEEIGREFGRGPYVFYGGERSLPVCFALREVIPSVPTGEELAKRREPGLVVIAQTKNNRVPPAVPEGFVQKMTIRSKDQVFEVYRAE